MDIATNGERALDLAREHRPGLVLVDVGLPDQSGLVVGERILEALPETKVVVVTAICDPSVLKRAAQLGFAGVLTKDTPAGRFSRAIEGILDGQIVIPRRAPRSWNGDPSDPAWLIADLTGREREVLELLVEGVSSGDISRRLHVSNHTVRTHVQNVLTKLQVHSRLEAAVLAVRSGSVSTSRAVG